MAKKGRARPTSIRDNEGDDYVASSGGGKLLWIVLAAAGIGGYVWWSGQQQPQAQNNAVVPVPPVVVPVGDPAAGNQNLAVAPPVNPLPMGMSPELAHAAAQAQAATEKLAENPYKGWGFHEHLIDVQGATRGGSATPEGDRLALLRQPVRIAAPNPWNVVADPPLTPIARPGGTRRKPLRWTIPTGFAGRVGQVLFPAGPSSCVAIGVNDGDQTGRIVLDLTQNKELGRIVGSHATWFPQGTYALSPNGAILVAAGKDRMGTMFVNVLDVATGKPRASFTLGDVQELNWVAQPNTTHAVFASKDRESLAVVDLNEGRIVAERKTPSAMLDQDVAFSPGGRYLAQLQSDGDGGYTLEVADVVSGDTVGSLVVPLNESQLGASFQPTGLRFSADGTELAALWDFKPQGVLLIWDLATGLPKEQFVWSSSVVAAATGGAAGDWTPLEFCPGTARILLYEHGLLDRATGKFVVQLPPSREAVPHSRRALSDDSFTVVDYAQRDTGLLILDLPEKVDAPTLAAKKIELTPTESSPVTGLLTLNEPTTDPVAEPKVLTPRKEKWSLTAEPTEPMTVGTPPVSLEGADRNLRVVLVRGATAPQAIGFHSPGAVPLTIASGVPNLEKLGGLRRRLERAPAPTSSASAGELVVWDAATGARIAGWPLGFPAELLDVSADAKLALLLTWNPAENHDEVRERLVVMDLEQGQVMAHRVVIAETAAADERMLVAGAFTGTGHVVTLTAAGDLMVRSLPDLAPQYAMADVAVPVLSPNGTHLGFSNGKDYFFVDVATGKGLGHVAGTGPVSSAAWNPAGDRWACVTISKDGPQLVLVDTNIGKTLGEFPIPDAEGPLAWCDNTRLLVSQTTLFDVESKQVAWNLTPDAWAHHQAQPLGGRHWWLATDGDAPKLLSAALPGPKLDQLLTAAKTKSPFLVKPGDPISLAIDYRFSEPRAQFKAETQARLETLLRRRGYKLVAAGYPQLTVVISEQSKSHSSSFTRSFNGQTQNENRSFDQRTAILEVTLKTAKETVWKYDRAFRQPLPADWPSAAFLTANDAAAIASDQPWNDLTRELEQVARWLPMMVLDPKAKATAGGLGWRELAESAAKP